MGKSDYVDFLETRGQIFVKFSRLILGLNLIRALLKRGAHAE